MVPVNADVPENQVISGGASKVHAASAVPPASEVLQFRPHPSDAANHAGMAAKVTERLWEIGHIVGVLEAFETHGTAA